MLRRMSNAIRYYDIGFNLTDPMYQGVYHGKSYHEADIAQVLHRCQKSRASHVLLTGSSIHESKEAIALSQQFHGQFETCLYYTLGVHPCCVNEFVLKDTRSTIDNPTNDQDFNAGVKVQDVQFTRAKLRELYSLVSEQASRDDKFRAIGEIGLDYDRLYYSSEEMQKLFFEEQLKLSCLFPHIPLFLHMRNCCDDFVRLMDRFVKGWYDSQDRFDWKGIISSTAAAPGGHMPAVTDQGIFYKFSPNRKFVVHSFTGSPDELGQLLDLSPNCFIGMNGCSFKTKENIESVKAVPLDRLLLETDAPWCDIRRTHESYKYLFDEPAAIDLEKTDPWNHGLEKAYPDLDSWFKSVKRDKLVKKSQDEKQTTMVKSRNEPCTMGHVATVVANVKQVPLEHLVETVWKTSCDVYGK